MDNHIYASASEMPYQSLCDAEANLETLINSSAALEAAKLSFAIARDAAKHGKVNYESTAGKACERTFEACSIRLAEHSRKCEIVRQIEEKLETHFKRAVLKHINDHHQFAVGNTNYSGGTSCFDEAVADEYGFCVTGYEDYSGYSFDLYGRVIGQIAECFKGINWSGNYRITADKDDNGTCMLYRDTGPLHGLSLVGLVENSSVEQLEAAYVQVNQLWVEWQLNA